jgi:hypothetical protein
VTSTTLTVRAEIEAEIARRLPAALLDRGVLRHCRKYSRACGCPHCGAKREVSSYFTFRFGPNDDHTTRKDVFQKEIRPRVRATLAAIRSEM